MRFEAFSFWRTTLDTSSIREGRLSRRKSPRPASRCCNPSFPFYDYKEENERRYDEGARHSNQSTQIAFGPYPNARYIRHSEVSPDEPDDCGEDGHDPSHANNLRLCRATSRGAQNAAADQPPCENDVIAPSHCCRFFLTDKGGTAGVHPHNRILARA
jgi:hypothetical protein